MDQKKSQKSPNFDLVLSLELFQLTVMFYTQSVNH